MPFKYTQIAKNLFEWNRKHLVHNSKITHQDLAHFFAPTFRVEANGRIYEANYANYADFLEGFKSTIFSITYQFQDCIESKDAVAIPLKAHIVRLTGEEELFEAILILRFDAHDKIVVWHEVYVKAEA